MFKKLVSLLLILCLACSLCACTGESSTKVSVTFSDGTSENMTVQEIVELSENDGRRFKEVKMLKGEGKVTNVSGISEAGWIFPSTPTKWSVTVDIGEDIRFIVYVNNKNNIPDLYNGDVVEFSGMFFAISDNKASVHCEEDTEGHYIKLK